jgi:hypothetical protein
MSLRDNPASLRESSKRTSRDSCFADQSRRIEARVTGDEFGSFREVQERCFGPAYGSSHFAIR